MSRDRVSMDLVIDRDVQTVLEFMQSNISTAKLVGVAESLPGIGRLLWSQYEQEPFNPIRMELPSATRVADQSRSVANESSPVQGCADGDSVAEESV